MASRPLHTFPHHRTGRPTGGAIGRASDRENGPSKGRRAGAARLVALLVPALFGLQGLHAQPAASPGDRPAPPSPTASAASGAPAERLPAVAITGRAEPAAGIAGWGDAPLSRLPIQATVFGSASLADAGAHRLADLVRFDPALSDAYNTEGYWDYLTVRGYVIDNRYNYRRDGLPINAETTIALDNKSQVEVLKGTSGIQAGTSAPGGLVNFVVKRPTDAPLRSARLEWSEPGTVTGAVDLSQRFGVGDAFGVRLNAAAARLDPQVRDARGERELVALAADWRVSADTLLEAEIEHSRRSQPSVPGFSLLGNRVPAPVDPRINLNDQPWSLPVVLDGDTASLRWRQTLGAGWRFTAHAATQRLRSDDRAAFPFGCTDADGTYYADRYCPNGNFDLYDFRSENERRRTDVIDLSVDGRLSTGDIAHTLTVGLQRSRVRDRFQPQAYNYVGTGNVNGEPVTPADPTTSPVDSNRDERTTELYLRDAVALTERLTAWLGLRHTRLDRGYRQAFTTPWVGLGYAWSPGQLVYASWGQGVESDVVPALPRYASAGSVLPALRSRQSEVGLKGGSDGLDWNLAVFDIQQPIYSDFGACDDTPGSCSREADGTEHHRGVEASAGWRTGPWLLRGGIQHLIARREDSRQPDIDGKRPVNVPANAVKLQTAYDTAWLPGLQLQGSMAYESRRMVLPDNSASIPGYTRFDVAARYEAAWRGNTWTWRAGIDNLFDRRAWRESPYQFSHVYLFPLEPRTVRLSVQVDL